VDSGRAGQKWDEDVRKKASRNDQVLIWLPIHWEETLDQIAGKHHDPTGRGKQGRLRMQEC